MSAVSEKRPTQELEVLSPDTGARSVIDASSILATINRAAGDEKTNVEKFERMMALYERTTALQAEHAFNAAMHAVQSELPQVVRDADNQHTKSRYARLETISAAIGPVLAKHGFSISFGTAESPLDGHYRIVADVSHGRHTRRYQADIPADLGGAKGASNKSATHAFGSTMTYGRRYLKCLIFDVVVKGEDDDGNGASRGSGETITDQQAHRILDMLNEDGADIARFCRFMKVAGVAEIPAKRFDEAVKAIQAARAARARKGAQS